MIKNVETISRLNVKIQGLVQGLGFRPFVYRLATELAVAGWISNTPQGVELEVEAVPEQLEVFLRRLEDERPPISIIQKIERVNVQPRNIAGFTIRQSNEGNIKTALVLPDLATCPECLEDVLDKENRRYLYPFTNCTNCGPRYSIIEALPYDRRHTSMQIFPMCSACEKEYCDPLDRRFHAQPNACPECGPHLEFWDARGEVLTDKQDAIIACAREIRGGKIVAVKGLGGFHLFADANNKDTIQELRRRKSRPAKPFALMVARPEDIEQACSISEIERTLMESIHCPILLLKKIPEQKLIPEEIAPANACLGVMLPGNPIHYLLMEAVQGPLIATSGNLAGEPICIDESEALDRLAGIADFFLVHNRPIVRHVDDSIVRIVKEQPTILRRARGYAPLPIHFRCAPLPPIQAMGAHLKNTLAINVNQNIFVSQHIGDLDNPVAYKSFQETGVSLRGLYDVRPRSTACDLHPDYLSTGAALESELPTERIQHHHAHIAACMAENNLEGDVLGICWDGSGLGPDQSIWGGEFLQANYEEFTRLGHLKTFRLPGGEKAIREPRRSALGLLYAMEPAGVPDFSHTFTEQELKLLQQMLEKKLNSPETSSMGRLFDGVASLLGLCQSSSFEGEAAIALEYEASKCPCSDVYPFEIIKNTVFDWTPMLLDIISERNNGIEIGIISAKFHNTLIEAALSMAKRCGLPRIVLSGGCFQNLYLTEGLIQRLEAADFKVYWHRQVPTNDGGISLGQLVIAAYREKKKQRENTYVSGSSRKN